MISKLLNLMLTHERRVLNYEIVHRQRCCDCRLVGYHVEIEAAVTVRGMLNKTCIDDCTGRWIRVGVTCLLDKAGVDLFVN